MTIAFGDVKPSTRKAMQANRAKDTKPEMVVRRLVHGMGYRYQLHRNDLPGKPDLAFVSRKAAVEVRGCFWHAHGCSLAHIPLSRAEYWGPKIAGNKARDGRNIAAMSDLGWRVLEVWECDVRRRPADVIAALQKFLGPTSTTCKPRALPRCE